MNRLLHPPGPAPRPLSAGSAPTIPGGEDGRGKRSRSSRLLRALAVALIAAGALMLIDATVTLVWQEPITALYTALRQHELGSELSHAERTLPTPAERRTLVTIADQRRRIRFLARELERRATEGTAVGRIEIPRIGARFFVVKGTSTGDLRSGPGIFPATSFPGAGETTAIAGHRTTYLAPFRHVDELRAGDAIELRMPYGLFTYAVSGHRVVPPSDVGAAVARLGYQRLVLSACTPLFSAAKRLLVFARLVRTVPRGAARELPGGAIARPIEARGAPPRDAEARRSPAVLVSPDPLLLSPLA